MKGKILASFLISIMVVGAFMWIQTKDQTNIVIKNNTTTPHNKHPDTSLKTRETMTLPYEMKVLLEDKNAWYQQSGEYYDYLIEFLENNYGFVVNATSIDNIYYNSSNITNYWLVIVPNPSRDNLTVEQQEAIVDFVNNSKGYAWVLGDRHPYTNKFTLDNITKKFYIEILKDIVKDPTDNYDNHADRPYIHVWANNSIAKYVSENGSYVVYTYKTSAVNFTNISVNGTKYYLYPLAVGDNDTNLTYASLNGSDVIYFAMVETLSHGYMLTGGSYGWITDYNFGSNDTSKFIEKLINFGLSRDLEIVSYEIPSEPIIYGEQTLVNVTVKNNAPYAIYNVCVGVEFSGTVDLENATNYMIINSLSPGGVVTITFNFTASGTSDVILEFKTWSVANTSDISSVNSSIIGYQLRTTFKTVGLLVDAWLKSDFIVLSSWNFSNLYINLTNPTSENITNIEIDFSYPAGIMIKNVTPYSYGTLANNSQDVIRFRLEANASGSYTITIIVNSDVGTLEDTIKIAVFTRPFILYDQGHSQHYKYKLSYSGMSMFKSILESFGEIYVNNDTFRSDIVGNASLIIIPNLGKNLTDDEIGNLTSYVESGGSLILMGGWYGYPDYFDPTSYNAITSQYGIIWNGGEIIDEDSYDYATYYPLLGTYCINPVATYMTIGLSELYVRSSTYLNISPPAFAIVRGNPTSYSVGPSGDPSGINGTDIIAIAAVEANSGKILAIGGTKTVDNYGMGYDSNVEFLKRALNWLLGEVAVPTNEAPEIEITWNIGSYDYEGTTFYFANVYVAVMEDWELYHVEIILDGQVIKDVYPSSERYYYAEIPPISTSGTHNVTVVVYDYEGLMAKTSQMIDVPEPTTPQNVTTTVTSTVTETTTSLVTTISSSTIYSTIESVPPVVLGGIAVLAVALVGSLAMLFLKRKTV